MVYKPTYNWGVPPCRYIYGHISRLIDGHFIIMNNQLPFTPMDSPLVPSNVAMGKFDVNGGFNEQINHS